jgi:DNA-binding MarR family transcriptional regulator
MTMSCMTATASVATAQVKAVRGFNRFYTQRIGVLDPYLGSELSLTEVRVLYELAHRDQPTASRAGARPGTGRRLPEPHPAPLRNRGWLARAPSPADARQSLLKLTEAGHAGLLPLAAEVTR